jgi:hypothetical protein
VGPACATRSAQIPLGTLLATLIPALPEAG